MQNMIRVLFFSACLLPQQAAFGEIVFEVFPLEGEGYEFKDDTIYFRQGNCGLVLKGADVFTRSSYYSQRGYSGPDPMAKFTRPDHTLLLITLFNRTESALKFNPREFVMSVDGRTYAVSQRSDFMEAIQQVKPDAQRILQRSVFFQEETIAAGQVISRFLIYSGTPHQAKRIELRMDNQFCPEAASFPVFLFSKVKAIRN